MKSTENNSSAIIDFIIKWFVENTNIKAEEIKDKINENYFEKGWIDSFKFISFISDLENNFNISFSDTDFQDITFSTIKGLAKIINRIIKK